MVGLGGRIWEDSPGSSGEGRAGSRTSWFQSELGLRGLYTARYLTPPVPWEKVGAAWDAGPWVCEV